MFGLLALVLSLFAAEPAVAQGCGPQNPNCIVPTAPVGTSNNQAASTEFVNTAIGGSPMAADSFKCNPTGSPTTPIDCTGAQAESLLQFTQSGTGAVQQALDARIKLDALHLKDFGASANALAISTGTVSITSGTGALTVTAATFTSNDVGKIIRVDGAGGSGSVYFGTITGFTSGTQVTVSPNASTTLSAVSLSSTQQVVYGTDNQTALQNWITQCQTSGQVCEIDAGAYAFGSALSITNTLAIRGQGRQSSILYPLNPSITQISINTNNPVSLRSFAMWGPQFQGISTTFLSITGSSQNFGSILEDLYWTGGNTFVACTNCQNLRFNKVSFFNAINNGIILGNANQPLAGEYFISDSEFALIQTASVRQTCITLQSGGNLVIVSSIVHFCNTAINIQQSTGTLLGDIFITGNSIEQNDNNGITFNKGTSSTVQTIQITGNDFGGGTPNSIVVNGTTAYLQDMSIVGNTFYPNGGTAISLPNGASLGGGNITITGNSFATGGGTTTGINVSGNAVTGAARGNTFRGITTNSSNSSPTFYIENIVSGHEVIGTNGVVGGQITFNGSTSGSVVVTPQSAAGSATFTLPNTSGTPAISVPSPFALSATTGALSWSGLNTNGILVADTTTSVVTNRCTIDSGQNFQCTSASSFNPFFTLTNSTADTGAAQYVFQKNRTGGNSNSGDLLGAFFFKGFANSAQQNSAQFTATQTAAAVGSNIPTKAELSTSNTSGQANQTLRFDSAAHLSVSAQATAPTITAGCNGAGSSITGGAGAARDAHGTVTGQTAAATTCTITFATAFTNTPDCMATGLSSPLTGTVTPSTTTLVVNFASTANYKWSYVCMGN